MSTEFGMQKLNGSKNYHTWSFAVKNVIAYKGLSGCITDPVTESRVDKLESCKALLSLCVESCIYAHIDSCDSALEIWSTLKRLYEDKGLSRKIGLLRSLISIRLEDTDHMQSYVDEIICCSKKLSGIGFTITDEWLGAIVLAGLSDIYKPFIMGIEASGSNMSSDQIISKLIDTQESQQNGYEAFFSKKQKKAYQKKQFKKKCFNCGSTKHLCYNCDKSKKSPNGKPEKEHLFQAMLCGKQNSNDWYIDSGASSHMTPNVDVFRELRSANVNKVMGPNGSKMKVKSVGNTTIRTNEHDIEVKEVLHVPTLCANLLSVNKIVEKGNVVIFNKDGCTIRNKYNKIIARSTPEKGMYKIRSISKYVLSQQNETTMNGHRKLGHMSLNKKTRNYTNSIKCAHDNNKLKNCKTYAYAKQTRNSLKVNETKCKEILKSMESDLMDSMDRKLNQTVFVVEPRDINNCSEATDMKRESAESLKDTVSVMDESLPIMPVDTGKSKRNVFEGDEYDRISKLVMDPTRIFRKRNNVDYGNAMDMLNEKTHIKKKIYEQCSLDYYDDNVQETGLTLKEVQNIEQLHRPINQRLPVEEYEDASKDDETPKPTTNAFWEVPMVLQARVKERRKQKFQKEGDQKPLQKSRVDMVGNPKGQALDKNVLISRAKNRSKDKSSNSEIAYTIFSTFCVVSKRFRKNYIHRFTATNSFFLFSPWNPTRRACIFLSTNQYFDYVVMATILLNCVFLAMTETVEEAEYIFLGIYTCEMLIKSIAKGFILNNYTYLRNPWNWLDFVVITSGYATICMDVGNLSGLRTFRVLRALKTVSIMPGLKTIINALLHSFKQLAEVMTLTIFCLMVFALFALQVYMGELRNKCVLHMENTNATYIEWHNWTKDEDNWLWNANEEPVICGNLTGARHCPANYTCICVGENPNHGYTSFDNFLWAMLTTFQLITLDYWENVYNMILSACGPLSVPFFTVVVFFGSFYLINLMLAVVALSYEEEAEITQEERRKDLTDHREDSTFSFDPSNLNVKKLGKHKKKRVDSRKGVLLASYSRKKTRRRKRGRSNASGVPGGGGEHEKSPPSSGGGQQSNNHNNSNTNSKQHSVTPSPSPSPRHSNCSSQRPQVLPIVKTAQIESPSKQQKLVLFDPLINPFMLPQPQPPERQPQLVRQQAEIDPRNMLAPNRGQLHSRQASSNASEGNNQSSLDDSGVVDDHEETDAVSEEVNPPPTSTALVVNTSQTTTLQHQSLLPPNVVRLQRMEVTPVTVALSPKEIRVIKCNGVGACKKKRHHTNMYTIPPDYLSHIVVLDDLPDRNCASCSSCCVDYTGWLQFQNSLYKVVRDPLFELAITLCIVLNTIILALEHHGMSEQIRQALDIGNKVFTSIFTFECILKLMALSKEFFACGWNIFDLIIVSASLLDLIFELVDGLSVLRGLRLLRVLKLAQSWTTMKVLLSIIISTIGALGNLTFVLVIVIYIFAVIGMQLFSKDYTPAKFEPDPVPRWNFNDFFHSFMMIFRILCGEWIEPLWDCMRAEQDKGPETCFFIFLPALVMGNFMVLNLFLALLLNSFNSEELKAKKDEVGEDSKLARSFERIRSIVRKKRFDRENSENKRNMRLEQIVREVMERQGRDKNFATTIQETVIGYPREKKIYRRSYQEAIQRPISGSDFHYDLTTNYSLSEDPQIKQFSTLINGNSEDEKMAPHSLEQDGDYGENNKLLVHQLSSGVGTQHTDIDVNTESIELRNFNRGTSADTDPETSLSPPNNPLDDDKLSKSPSIKKHNEGDMNPTESTKDPVADEKGKEDGGDPTKARPWHTLVSYVDELTVGGRRNSKGQYIDGIGTFPFAFGRRKSQKVPQDCFPRKCNERCPCWDKMLLSKYGLKWTKIRSTVLSVVDTPAFEWFILVLIFASSITLCFEDIYLEFNPRLRRVLYWTNLAFCVIFTIEMILKWVALGFSKYFSSFWTVLDFVIVFVSVFSLLIEENENLKVLRSLRTLRALRPLRAISRWQGMRIVVNALMYAIPSIFNVLLVCLVFWLIFSIMGVQFFGGKFFKCVDNDGELLPITVVDNKWECAEKNYTWVNSKITFDHVGIAYLALFQVATFEGWMEVMADAVDARGVDLQPQREANLYAYIYFVIFIVCGSFFTLNLFIGVIIDNFNMLKKKYEGGVLEMFLTESQKHYYTAMKKLGRKKPQKVIKRPINQVIAMFYDLSNSRRFEIAIFVLIFLNMLTMGIEHYGQPHPVFFILEVSNAFFTTVFGLEAIVKMIGLRYHYFTVPWNMFDFWLVLASILGILMEDIMIDFPVSPTLLRVVRVFRIGRILRLIKAAKGIRKLLFALVVSLPALFNIGALLALITFIYAIIGMSVFGHVKQQGALDDMVNFETFGRSMQLLFRLMTSAGWNDVLESLMIQPPHCDPHFNNQTNGDCGYPLLAITYFTSFIIISYMIVINMYIAIILENFNQAHQEEEIGIVEDDLEMFYIRWSKYDPHATQFIRFTQLSDFIASLDPPLGISKPNIVALVSFNLPIARGNKIHCLDILHSLVKHVLGHVEETDTFRQLQEQMDIKFKKQFPTRKELEIVSSTRIWKREDKAARLIQTTFRNYIKRKHEKEQEPEVEDETTQTSSPGGGWQGRLSAFLHVHRGSRASSRKSSRASDASDLSELGGAWLNLPLLLLSSAAVPGTAEDLQIGRDPNDVSITVSQPSPDTHTPTSPLAPPPQARRRSFYNFPFFLRHQDAVEKTDDESTSPLSVKRGSMKSSGTMLSLHPTTGTTTTEEVKMRRGSLIRRKPPLERAPSGGLRLSGSALPIINTLQQPPNGTDVSILVTEPSPEAPIPVIPTSTSSTTPVIAPPTSIFQRPNLHRQQSEATVVHVLVHRESEEYNVEEDS